MTTLTMPDSSQPVTPASTAVQEGRPVFPPDVGGWEAALAAGPQALAQVTGPFAVAAQGAAGEPALAVDRFARESLCWTAQDGQLRAARRADELAGPGAQLDPQALYDYLFFHAIPSPRTVFAGVNRLPAAHWLRMGADGPVVAPYWVPRFEPPRQEPSFEAAKQEFRRLLQNAVQRELDGGKAGCFLSGGTDSSTVAGMISLATGGAAATYSIGFEAEGYDEMAFARIAAKRFGTEHHEYYVTPDDLLRLVPTVAAAYDQPFGNSSALPAFCCARMARNDGLTRILAGDGGDELFGGNSRYAKQRIFDAYLGLPAALRRGAIEPLLAMPGLGSLPLARKAVSYVDQARRPMPHRHHLYNLLLRLGVDDVLEPAFLSLIDQQEPGQRQQEVWDSAVAEHALDRTLAYDWRWTLAESDLPKVRETTRMAGLEVGFPMLDEDLLAFSMRLPPSWKLKGGRLRWFFKEALRGFLPDEILDKKKQGFGLPFGVWTTRHAGLRALAEDSLGSLGTRGMVRPAFTRALMQEHLAQHPGYYGEMVWILMMLEQWLRTHAPDWRLNA